MAGLVPAIHDFASLPSLTGQSSSPFRMTKSGCYWVPAFAGMTLGNSWMPGTSAGMRI